MARDPDFAGRRAFGWGGGWRDQCFFRGQVADECVYRDVGLVHLGARSGGSDIGRSLGAELARFAKVPRNRDGVLCATDRMDLHWRVHCVCLHFEPDAFRAAYQNDRRQQGCDLQGRHQD